jgi:hypothetical protein
MDIASFTTYPRTFKIIAKTISYLLHPLFIPVYFYFFLIQIFPYEFAGAEYAIMYKRLIAVFMNTVFFPAFTVFLLWRLKFIDSIYMHTQKERIVPYIAIMFFYWWMYYLSRNFTDQPIVLKPFYLGIFLTTPIALIVNNFYKISMHALGMGGLLGILCITSFFYQINLSAWIIAVTFLSGLVCTSRMLLGSHNTREIYHGFIVGLLAQIVAAYFTL